jgi:hypothetical protein
MDDNDTNLHQLAGGHDVMRSALDRVDTSMPLPLTGWSSTLPQHYEKSE